MPAAARKPVKAAAPTAAVRKRKLPVDDDGESLKQQQEKKLKKRKSEDEDLAKKSLKKPKLIKADTAVKDSNVDAKTKLKESIVRNSKTKTKKVTTTTTKEAGKRPMRPANFKEKPAKPMTKKERRAQKKQQKRNADLVSQLLTLWEELRIDTTAAARVATLCDQAVTLAAGKINELAYSHDTVRIFEAVLKRGNEKHRWTVFNELKNEVGQLSKSKYGKHLVLKLIKYGCKEHRHQIFRCIDGKAAEMLKHKHASDVIEFAYNEFATAAQRASIVQEFYGAQQALFKSDRVNKLTDALSAAPDVTRRNAIIDSLRQNLLTLARKDLLKHSLTHHLLLEFLTEKPDDEQLLEGMRDRLIPLLHTRDGVKVGIAVLKRTTGGRLKLAMKSMKTFLSTTAINEHGYLFIISLLEQIHSPDLLHKFVLRELMESLSDLIANQFGRKVLLYALSPRNPVHFSPQLLQLLPTDTDLTVLNDRLQIALQLCATRLLMYIAANMQQLCQENSTVLLVTEAIIHCPGDKSSCYASLTKLIAEPFTPAGDADKQQQQHIIERSATHLMLKRLLATCPDLVRCIGNELSNQQQLVDCIGCNRGCFFLLMLYNNCPSDSDLRDRIGQLKQQLAAPAASGLKGAQVLLEKLG